MRKRAESEFGGGEQPSHRDRSNPRSLIRPTLVGDQLKFDLLDNDDEYILQRYRADGESSRENSLVDIPTGRSQSSENLKGSSSKDSKLHKRKASANTPVGRASVPEWHILRLFTAVGGGFDLEMWWSKSDANNRLIAILVVSLFLVALLNLGFAIAFIASAITEEPPKSPYICETEDCKKMFVRIHKTMDRRILPCDNFYEFMCKNYTEVEEEGSIFADLITKPNLKVEIGTESILGTILKSKKDSDIKTYIKFFQTCLNFDKRANFSHATLARNAEQWFGTTNFTLFETQSKPMDEIGASLLQAFGHASFINMGFYTYPYILILEPHDRTTKYRFGHDPRNEDFLKKLFTGLMAHLGLKSNETDIIKDMVTGTDVMSTVIHEIYSAVKIMNITVDATLKTTPPEIKDLIINGEKLKGLCPPMGLSTDLGPEFYFKVLNLFINETYKVEYISPTAHKFVLALQVCFSQGSGSFTKYTITHKKIAFVSLWIVDIFLNEIILGLNYKNMTNDWELGSIGVDHTFVGQISDLAVLNNEYACLDTLWTVLGYLPTTRFLLYGNLGLGQTDPVTWKLAFEETGGSNYIAFRHVMRRLPDSEIDWRARLRSATLFKREVDVDIGLPLAGGILGNKVGDLNFTDDFLGNTLDGFRYTMEWARQYWLGSTNPKPYIRFMGNGGPGNIRDTLLVPHFVRSDSARLVERQFAAKNDEWETFLGRKRHHYVRLPISMFDDRDAHILSLSHAFITLPRVRAMASLLTDAASKEKYPSLTWEELMDIPADGNVSIQQAYRNCSILDASLDSTNETRHQYKMIPSNISHYTWEKEELFLSLVSVKIAYAVFLLERNKLNTSKYFPLAKYKQDNVLNKQLPFERANYTENQLFFMGFARQICRESWKSKNHETELERQRHYSLEATLLNVLMQLDDFAEVFNCTGNSMMNNKGQPRCLKKWA